MYFFSSLDDTITPIIIKINPNIASPILLTKLGEKIAYIIPAIKQMNPIKKIKPKIITLKLKTPLH